MKVDSTMNQVRALVHAALGTGLLAGAAPAFPADEEPAELERVEVTGSRIKRVQVEGAAPVVTIAAVDMERSGHRSVGEFLQELSAVGPALNTNFNNGGDGSTRVSLRNLGPDRTLILVNGRRWVPVAGDTGVGGAIDLNSIPLSVIDRIEILKDGASAIYGADAVTGVINIITRRDYQGMQAKAEAGEYQVGDGRQEAFDFTAGAATTRSSVLMNASYMKAEPVWAGDRRISREPIFGTGNAFGSSVTPMGRIFVPDAGTPFTGFGATRDLGADATPDVTDFRPFDRLSDSYNFAPDNYLSTPSDRWSLYVQGHHDLSSQATVVVEALYSHRRSEQLLAALPLAIGQFGDARANGQHIGVHATNPYNIFAMDLVPATAAFADPARLQLAALAKRLSETGGRRFQQDVVVTRFGMGLEGSFQLGSVLWDWNVGHSYASAANAESKDGLVDGSRVAQALGPVAACTAPCVPLNLFGGLGAVTPEMLDYISVRTKDLGGYELRNQIVNLSAEPWELPGGPLGLALGAERRREDGFDEPDALGRTGNLPSIGTGNRETARGGYVVEEAFLELAVPIVRDVRFAQSAEISLAGRYSDYSNFGTTSNTKYGFRWQPFDDLLLRATWQDAFRAPRIDELFRARILQTVITFDPCSFDDGVPGAPFGLLDPTPDDAGESQLLANCTGQPVSNDHGSFLPEVPGPFVPSDASYIETEPAPVLTGGNPDLQPERARVQTAGLVYSPGWMSGLSFTVDWFDVDVAEAIQSVGNPLNACYLLGVAPACELVSRDPVTGQVLGARQVTHNVSRVATSGADLTIDLRAVEFGVVPGFWGWSFDVTYVKESIFCEGRQCIDRTQALPFNVFDQSMPAFKASLAMDWAWHDWEIAWRTRFVGAHTEFCQSVTGLVTFCSDPNPDGDTSTFFDGRNRKGATTYHSVQVTYSLTESDTRLTWGMQNVGDKRPPIAWQAFANSFDPTTYEVPGRFTYLRISKIF